MHGLKGSSLSYAILIALALAVGLVAPTASADTSCTCYVKVESTSKLSVVLMISEAPLDIPLDLDVFNETEVLLSTSTATVELPGATRSFEEGLVVTVECCCGVVASEKLNTIVNLIEQHLGVDVGSLVSSSTVGSLFTYKLDTNFKGDLALEILQQVVNQTRYGDMVRGILAKRGVKVEVIAIIASKHYMPWYGEAGGWVETSDILIQLEVSGVFSPQASMHNLDFSSLFKVDELSPPLILTVELPSGAQIKSLSFEGSSYTVGEDPPTVTATYNERAPAPSITFTYQFPQQPVSLVFTEPLEEFVSTPFIVEVAVTGGKTMFVEFYLDGELKGNVTQPPWRIEVQQCSLGVHTIEAIAHTEFGVCSGDIEVTVVGPPRVTLTSPSNGSKVSGVITISAAVEGDVERVEFYVDGSLIQTLTKPPWQASWDTSLASEGQHTITVVATSSYGSSSSTVTIIVEGAPQPPSKCIIATVAYGSELAPEVQMLRSFRDQYVMSTFAGRCFMEAFNAFYYSWSPSIAEQLYYSEPAKAVVRALLQPLLAALSASKPIYEALSFNPELAVVTAGLAVSLLIGAFYLTPVLLAVSLIRRAGVKPLLKAVKVASTIVLASLASIALSELFTSSVAMTCSTTTLVLSAIALGGLALTIALIKAISIVRLLMHRC